MKNIELNQQRSGSNKCCLLCKQRCMRNVSDTCNYITTAWVPIGHSQKNNTYITYLKHRDITIHLTRRRRFNSPIRFDVRILL